MPKIENLDQKKTRYVMKLSKKWHFQTCLCKPKNATAKQMHDEYMEKHSGFFYASFRSSRSQLYAERKREKMMEIGHDPVLIDYTNWALHRVYGNCFLACTTCRGILKLTNRSRKCCKGSAHSFISPGVCFWKEAQKRNRMEEMAKIFKMSEKEMDKVNATLAIEESSN